MRRVKAKPVLAKQTKVKKSKVKKIRSKFLVERELSVIPDRITPNRVEWSISQSPEYSNQKALKRIYQNSSLDSVIAIVSTKSSYLNQARLSIIPIPNKNSEHGVGLIILIFLGFILIAFLLALLTNLSFVGLALVIILIAMVGLVLLMVGLGN